MAKEKPPTKKQLPKEKEKPVVTNTNDINDDHMQIGVFDSNSYEHLEANQPEVVVDKWIAENISTFLDSDGNTVEPKSLPGALTFKFIEEAYTSLNAFYVEKLMKITKDIPLKELLIKFFFKPAIWNIDKTLKYPAEIMPLDYDIARLIFKKYSDSFNLKKIDYKDESEICTATMISDDTSQVVRYNREGNYKSQDIALVQDILEYMLTSTLVIPAIKEKVGGSNDFS